MQLIIAVSSLVYVLWDGTILCVEVNKSPMGQVLKSFFDVNQRAPFIYLFFIFYFYPVIFLLSYTSMVGASHVYVSSWPAVPQCNQHSSCAGVCS